MRVVPSLFAVVGIAGLMSSTNAAAKPTVPPGFTITKLAAAPAGATNCDDLAYLGGNLFMGCQNATQSNGGGGNSTLVEVGLNGTVVHTWSIKDKIDGLAADPKSGRLIVTLDEDQHTHLATVTPSAPASQQVVNYAYSPNPDSPSTPAALQTGGGTDNVSVDANGNILITASHAKVRTGTAVFRVSLTPPVSSGGTGTATLSSTFADNATAQKGNGGAGSTTLKLTDVDSGAIVPSDSPRFAGSYVIDDQTALELVFAKNIFSGAGLTVMKTPYGLDDLRWVTQPSGTLYVVDLGAGTPGKSALYKVTGPFAKNTVLASNDSVSDQVGTVNLTTAAVTPFIRGLNVTKGLVYLDPSGTETALTPNGSPKTVASVNPKHNSGSSNTGLIIGIIAAVLVVLGAGGYALRRRAA